MNYTREDPNGRVEVVLNGEILDEVENFTYPETTIAVNGGVNANVSNKVNEEYKLGGMKKWMGMNVWKEVYGKILLPTVTYESELW